MANSLVIQIDMIPINEDGTIEIFDRPFISGEYPFPFQYKLYLPFEENEKEILRILFGKRKVAFEYGPRLGKYLENRKALYEEARTKYLSMVSDIENSDFRPFTKMKLIREIDLELNRLYPYTE